MKKILKDKKAITLIALVITIVVLVILAAVVISMTVGNDGLIAKAIKAANDYKNSKTQEEQGVNNMYSELLVATDGTATVNLKELETIILNKTYPVGSIYMTTDNKNPSQTLGGTWEKYAEGRTIIGDGEYTDKNNTKKTFNVGDADTGEYNHTLTTEEMPSHTHNFSQGGMTLVIGSNTNATGTVSGISNSSNGWWYDRNKTISSISSNGGSQSHNNIQPYVTTYIWKRTK